MNRLVQRGLNKPIARRCAHLPLVYLRRCVLAALDHTLAEKSGTFYQLGETRLYVLGRNRVPLALYARYNPGEKGVRLSQQDLIFAWRRAVGHDYPLDKAH